VAMAIGALPPMEGYKDHLARGFKRASDFHPSSFMLKPETALFLAIDIHCRLQNMDSGAQRPCNELDEVVYYVNKDFAGWVEQRVRRRVYIELKLECTRNRQRDNQKARDDWICLYCKSSFTSKLRLTDHRMVGCPCGPVDSSGVKWDLPMYPNLKTAKQGKDLKLALQRGEGSIWDNLLDNGIWLDLNPELREPILPPAGAKVQERMFMEPSLDRLAACPSRAEGSRQGTPRPERTPKQRSAPTTTPNIVDLEEETTQDEEASRSRSKKRPISELEEDRPRKRAQVGMEESFHVQHSPRQFKQPAKKPDRTPPRRNAGIERPKVTPHRNNVRPTRPSAGPPPHPIRVEPIQTRSPSPERVAILAPPTPVPHVPHAPSPSIAAPVPVKETPRDPPDIATRLRKERQAFYIKAANAARASVTMDTPKPTLRPPMQPPGLFYLLECGLLRFDLECGDFPAFLEEVENWKADPAFQDRLFLAYGRFYSPDHQVHHLFARNSHVTSYTHSGLGFNVVTCVSLVIGHCNHHACYTVCVKFYCSFCSILSLATTCEAIR
jgi:hypothetical protein